MLVILLLAVFCSSAFSTPISPESVTDDVALKYLTAFGYYNAVHLRNQMASDQLSSSIRSSQFKLAIKKLQTFAGLPVTGNLDHSTKSLMARKRCGIADSNTLQRDETTIYKWNKQVITWTIEKFSQDVSEENTRRALGQAFSVWQAVIPLDFIEVARESNKADIRVKFVTRAHDDFSPFDGRGGILAHAMFPRDGRLHFDDDENWVYMDAVKLSKYTNTDLISVAIHEIGHALGLYHSANQAAIMAPFYHEQTFYNFQYKIPQLHNDDVKRIQQLYGKRKGGDGLRPTTTLPPPIKTSTEAVTSCPIEIDDATKSVNGLLYAFVESNVWVLQGQRLHLPRPIRIVFPSGPDRVTAAVTNPRTQLTLLFNERTVFAYMWDVRSETFHLHRSFPKTLSGQIPFAPAAAFEWRDGNIVLISGDTFATYDENWNKPTIVQKTARYFRGFPEDVLAVLPVGKPGHMLLVTRGGCYDYDMNVQKLTNTDSLNNPNPWLLRRSSSTAAAPAPCFLFFAISSSLLFFLLFIN